VFFPGFVAFPHTNTSVSCNFWNYNHFRKSSLH